MKSKAQPVNLSRNNLCWTVGGTVPSPMKPKVWSAGRSTRGSRELAMKSCRAHMNRKVSKITLDDVPSREGTYNITLRNPTSKFTSPLLLNINCGDALNQLGQQHLLPNLSHDQTVHCNPSISRMHYRFRQQRTKGLPQTCNEPECASRPVKRSRIVRELLAGNEADPGVGNKKTLHSG